jgi:chaperone required for assembly of F1-ATPase
VSAWKPKRFWTAAAVVAVDGGWTVQLDGRAVKTPAKTLLVVPTEGLAQAIAAEWDAQLGEVKPETMPYTRTANSAIDKVAVQFDDVAMMLSAYGGSDHLCYRATGPEPLAARQAAAWDPLLDWAAQALDLHLTVTAGIMHVAQPDAALARANAVVGDLNPFQLAAFHDLVALSGSLVLALAVIHGRLEPAAAWALSRIDEDWQIEEWGADEEAAELTAIKHEAFLQAARFYGLCG